MAKNTLIRIDLSNLDDAFAYHAWTPAQQEAGGEIRDALKEAARVVLTKCAESPLRTRALNMIFDARMMANAALTFDQPDEPPKT